MDLARDASTVSPPLHAPRPPGLSRYAAGVDQFGSSTLHFLLSSTKDVPQALPLPTPSRSSESGVEDAPQAIPPANTPASPVADLSIREGPIRVLQTLLRLSDEAFQFFIHLNLDTPVICARSSCLQTTHTVGRYPILTSIGVLRRVHNQGGGHCVPTAHSKEGFQSLVPLSIQYTSICCRLAQRGKCVACHHSIVMRRALVARCSDPLYVKSSRSFGERSCSALLLYVLMST